MINKLKTYNLKVIDCGNVLGVVGYDYDIEEFMEDNGIELIEYHEVLKIIDSEVFKKIDNEYQNILETCYDEYEGEINYDLQFLLKNQ